MRKAVFIDRDGVINSDEGLYYIYQPQDFVLNEGIVENIALLKDAGFLIIVISNQGGIGKGLYSKNDTDTLSIILMNALKEKGYTIDEIYYCPHHPDTGNCLCRKPQPLLIEKAIARFDIDPSASFLIGDSPRDVDAAKNAGIKGILVKKNTNIHDICHQIIEGSLNDR
jgi:D-glycero-D-manno-heptose 1,7-bisphosphate phosphatase